MVPTGQRHGYRSVRRKPGSMIEKASGAQDLLPQISSVLKVVAWLIVLVFIMFHWSYFASWLRNTTHIELPGVKIDRFVEASSKAEQYAKTLTARDTGFDLTFAQAAIVRAKRDAPALDGALVLWVDNNPGHNKDEQSILEDFGIRFVRALSTDEAMERLDRDKYDLIITNVARQESPRPLAVCQVHYFDWPSDELKQQFNGNLGAFNIETNKAGIGGFVFMDEVKAKYREAAPPIIFYSASNGGKVVSLCAKTITNRADILLQSVISSLEEQRWHELSDNLPSSTSTR